MLLARTSFSPLPLCVWWARFKQAHSSLFWSSEELLVWLGENPRLATCRGFGSVFSRQQHVMNTSSGWPETSDVEVAAEVAQLEDHEDRHQAPMSYMTSESMVSSTLSTVSTVSTLSTLIIVTKGRISLIHRHPRISPDSLCLTHWLVIAQN